MSQRTGLSDGTGPVQTRKPISTELCIGRQPFEDFQLIHEHPSVIIGCNPGWFLEAPETVYTGSCLQNPQCVPLRDALTMPSPLSLPHVSGKTSETGEKKKKKNRNKDTQTFKYDGIFRAPKISEGLRDPIGHNMYEFRFISENIVFVGMPKILGRVDSEFVPICFS